MVSPKNVLRLCFISVLILTIFASAIYYWYGVNQVEEMGQGTLITIVTVE